MGKEVVFTSVSAGLPLCGVRMAALLMPATAGRVHKCRATGIYRCIVRKQIATAYQRCNKRACERRKSTHRK